MSPSKILLLCAATGLSITAVDWYTKPAPPQEEKKGPDVTTVVSASISSIQAQSKLLVMTSQMNAVATSQMDSMGMTAKQTDIATAEAQYFVDLTKVTKNNIKVTPESLTLTLPQDSLQPKLLPPARQDSYNNDSWLFTFNGDAATTLTRVNKLKMTQSFTQQSSGLKAQARINATYALTALLEAPLRARGFRQKVFVVFV